ncbi:signal peptidase [Neisseria weixii]|nr:signal peptidase [Neisseria weixii]
MLSGRLKEYRSDGSRPLQNSHLCHISSLCAARKLAYLHDLSALSVLTSSCIQILVLQRSLPL